MEYAAMVAGLCLKEAGGKWSSRLVRAGGSEQLYSGVTIFTQPSSSIVKQRQDNHYTMKPS